MSGIAWTVRHAHEGSPFFRDLLDTAAIDTASIETKEDLARLPLTTKEQLRRAGPFGWTCVPARDVVRIHASSGTTGRRIVATYTARDLDDWAQLFARSYEYAGVTPDDRVQVTPGYGLWTAGIGFQAGAERLGAMAVPTGPGNLDLQLEMLRDLESTVLCATASFGLLLGEEVSRRGLKHKLKLRKAILGAERWGEAMRRRIEELLGVEAFDIYGLTELYGPGMGIDCARHEGIHYWDDYFVIEVIDPESGAVLPPDTEGELVLTTLRKEAMPLLRYRTRDLSRIIPGPCSCGSPHPRIDRIRGRSDDMFKVRGVQVFPAQIDAVVDGEYQVVLSRAGGRERFLVRVEAADGAAIAERLKQALGVRPHVEAVPEGSLPRTDRKTRRVLDERD